MGLLAFEFFSLLIPDCVGHLESVFEHLEDICTVGTACEKYLLKHLLGLKWHREGARSVIAEGLNANSTKSKKWSCPLNTCITRSLKSRVWVFHFGF